MHYSAEMILHRRAVVAGLLAAPALLRRARAEAPPLPPRWQRYAMPAAAADDRPVISIIVDDLGVIHPGTARAVALPAPVTLAWFPFARDLPDQLAAAGERGHEALLHMPMQAFGMSIAWTGPDPLRIDLPPDRGHRRGPRYGRAQQPHGLDCHARCRADGSGCAGVAPARDAIGRQPDDSAQRRL
jgi:hypothetical protein